MKRLAAGAWLLALACATACAPGHVGMVDVLDDTATPLVGGAYVSAPLPTHDPVTGHDVAATRTWIPYFAREQLTIQFRQLTAPRGNVGVWIAFTDSGIGAAPAFGDTAHVSFDPVAFVPPGTSPPPVPASSVTITNATEQDYFVRVVVE